SWVSLTSRATPTTTSRLQVAQGGPHAVRQLLYLVVREHQRRRDLQRAAHQYPPQDPPSAHRRHSAPEQGCIRGGAVGKLGRGEHPDTADHLANELMSRQPG